MADLADLITRLQAAEGPDRGLDAEIACHVRYLPDNAPGWLRNWAGSFAPLPDYKPGQIAAMHTDGRAGVNWASPAYTGSIDAIRLALLPKDWFWQVGQTSIFPAWAKVYATHPDHGERGINEFVWKREIWEPPSTPELAFCIACLQAIAAVAKTEGRS